MSKENTLGAAIVHELCSICTKECNSSVVINTKLTAAMANKVESLHGKAIQWSKKPCDECADMMTKGFVLIGAVEAKTTDATNPYRSGNIWCVKQEVAEELFKPHGAPKSGVAFVDVTVALQMELPNVNINA